MSERTTGQGTSPASAHHSPCHDTEPPDNVVRVSSAPQKFMSQLCRNAEFRRFFSNFIIARTPQFIRYASSSFFTFTRRFLPERKAYGTLAVTPRLTPVNYGKSLWPIFMYDLQFCNITGLENAFTAINCKINTQLIVQLKRILDNCSGSSRIAARTIIHAGAQASPWKKS